MLVKSDYWDLEYMERQIHAKINISAYKPTLNIYFENSFHRSTGSATSHKGNIHSHAVEDIKVSTRPSSYEFLFVF